MIRKDVSGSNVQTVVEQSLLNEMDNKTNKHYNGNFCNTFTLNINIPLGHGEKSKKNCTSNKKHFAMMEFLIFMYFSWNKEGKEG